MQVRKFEARSMKEALEMVKRQLGPEAIILQARDNTNSFGLGGHSSVEVTAAISETTLRKKLLAERKMTNSSREKFQSASARTQRDFINKAMTEKKRVESPVTTAQRYVDITDDAEQAVSVSRALGFQSQHHDSELEAQDRIKTAAKSAWEAIQGTYDEDEPPAPIETAVSVRAQAVNNTELNALHKQINDLKMIIANFQKVPQNFINAHPGASEGISFELSASYEKLTRIGVSSENVVEMLKMAQENLPAQALKKQAFIDAWVAKYILDNVRITENTDSGRFHVFVGPAGQGKTSMLVKMASHMAMQKRKKVAILTTDTRKVGAVEQLKIYSQILNVPFAIIKSAGDWVKVEEKLSSFDHVLVDVPGLQLKNAEEVALMARMLPNYKSRRLHYVQSVLAKDEDASEIAKRYKQFGLSDVIFTNIDEASQHGMIYNFQKQFNLPLHSFGIGPAIPDDYEAASKERVVDLLFKLTKLKRDRGNR